MSGIYKLPRYRDPQKQNTKLPDAYFFPYQKYIPPKWNTRGKKIGYTEPIFETSYKVLLYNSTNFPLTYSLSPASPFDLSTLAILNCFKGENIYQFKKNDLQRTYRTYFELG